MSDTILPCPECGHLNRPDFCDGDGYLVTYWGDVDHLYCCTECDHEFRVREMVTRAYYVVEEATKGTE